MGMYVYVMLCSSWLRLGKDHGLDVRQKTVCSALYPYEVFAVNTCSSLFIWKNVALNIIRIDSSTVLYKHDFFFLD